MQHLDRGMVVEHGDLLERGERHLLRRGVAEVHAVELDGDRSVGHVERIGTLDDHRLDVEHLEDALEADERRHDVEASGGQGGQGGVQPVEEQCHRDDRAGIEVALQGEVAAEAVDERLGEPRHERQRAKEHDHRHRRADPDVVDALGPAGELVAPRRPVVRTA